MFYSTNNFYNQSGIAAIEDLDTNQGASLWTEENYENYKRHNVATPEQKAARLRKYLIMSLVAAESFEQSHPSPIEPFFDVRLDEFAEEWLEHQPEDDTKTQTSSIATSVTFNSISNHFRKNSDGLIDSSILKLSRDKEQEFVTQSKTYNLDSFNNTNYFKSNKKNLFQRQLKKISSFFTRKSSDRIHVPSMT